MLKITTKKTWRFSYDRSIRLCEIVLTEDSVDTSSNPEAFSKQVWLKLKSGEPFEELAKIYVKVLSRRTEETGAFLPHRRKSETKPFESRHFYWRRAHTPPFKVALLERKADGTIGASGRFAYYILFAKEVREGGYKNIDQVRPEIEKILADEIESKSQRKWLSGRKGVPTFILACPWSN